LAVDLSALLLAAVEKPPLTSDIRVPLSVLNFLEFAIWGAWWVVLGQYLETLQFTRKQIGRVYATMAVGAIVVPMFLGILVDIYFEAQQVLGVLHLLGSGLLLWLALTKREKLFYWIALLYAFAYQPTIGLANTVVFGHLPDASRDYPSIRVLGTIGWIVAGLSLKLLLKKDQPVSNRPIILASVLSLILGAYSFFLPHTPPNAHAEVPAAVAAAGEQQTPSFFEVLESFYKQLWLTTKTMFGDTSFAVFLVSALVVSGAFAFYFAFTSIYLEKRIGIRPNNVGPLMTLGQWVEIGGMLVLPFLLGGAAVVDPQGLDKVLQQYVPAIGMKAVLASGMIAVAARYALFAAGRPFILVILAIALHGICFDFFLAAGFIFVADNAPKEISGSAQALFIVLTYGFGTYFGTEGAGWLNQACTRDVVDPATKQVTRVTNWAKFWLVPAVISGITAVAFVLLFKQ
jgi:nucleoside transporter